MLLAALRRAGFELALSQGMKPRPVISLALARGVGVAAEDEICTIEVRDQCEPDELVARLNATLPDGVVVRAARPSAGTPDVVGADYRIAFDAAAAVIAAAVDAFEDADELIVERSSPKGRKTVDVRSLTEHVAADEAAVTVSVAVRAEGSARPAEIVCALEQCAGRSLPVTGITRTRVRVAVPAARGVTE